MPLVSLTRHKPVITDTNVPQTTSFDGIDVTVAGALSAAPKLVPEVSQVVMRAEPIVLPSLEQGAQVARVLPRLLNYRRAGMLVLGVIASSVGVYLSRLWSSAKPSDQATGAITKGEPSMPTAVEGGPQVVVAGRRASVTAPPRS